MRSLKNLTLATLIAASMAWALPGGAIISEPTKYGHGDGKLNVLNLNNGEELDLRYRGFFGYKKKSIDKIRKALRCRLTGAVVEMPLELIELVDEIQDHFGGKQVQVISGYRTPKLNNYLMRQGRKVAKNSYHMKGFAMDIRIPGVPTKQVRDFAKSLKKGGVGYYRRKGFVHVDVGPIRYW